MLLLKLDSQECRQIPPLTQASQKEFAYILIKVAGNNAESLSDVSDTRRLRSDNISTILQIFSGREAFKMNYANDSPDPRQRLTKEQRASKTNIIPAGPRNISEKLERQARQETPIEGVRQDKAPIAVLQRGTRTGEACL